MALRGLLLQLAYDTGIKLDTITARSVTYGGGKFVVVGSNGKASYSSDGITWTSLTAGTNRGIKLGTASAYSVTYGSGKFVVVGGYGTASYSFTPDSTPPTAAITYSTPAPYKAGASVAITATFSEPMADAPVPQITISGGNTLAATNMTKSSTTVYTYAYSVGAGNGTGTIAMSIGTDVATNVVTSAPTSGATFIVDNTAPSTPTASPSGAIYTSTQTVTLASDGSSVIYYTTNNTTPTLSSPVYAGPITLSSTCILSAMGADTAGNLSDRLNASYIIQGASSSSSSSPSANPPGGGSRRAPPAIPQPSPAPPPLEHAAPPEPAAVLTTPPPPANLPSLLINMRERMIQRMDVLVTKQPSLRAAMERVLQRLDARLAKRGRR